MLVLRNPPVPCASNGSPFELGTGRTPDPPPGWRQLKGENPAIVACDGSAVEQSSGESERPARGESKRCPRAPGVRRLPPATAVIRIFPARRLTGTVVLTRVLGSPPGMTFFLINLP